jgi:hypothetical protein
MAYCKSFAVALLTAAIFGISSNATAQDFVNGYYRSNGVNVPPYFRLAPYGRFYNNWSTFGNINPFAGRFGTTIYPLSNYGDGVFARDYYVPPRFRSAPDGNFYNNGSTYGNVNPYTVRVRTNIAPQPVADVPAELPVADVPAEGNINPSGRDLTRSAPPADRLRSRLRTYTRRPTYEVHFEPNSFDRP